MVLLSLQSIFDTDMEYLQGIYNIFRIECRLLLIYLCTNITSLSGFHGSRSWTDGSSISLVFWKTQFSQGLVILHPKNLKHNTFRIIFAYQQLIVIAILQRTQSLTSSNIYCKKTSVLLQVYLINHTPGLFLLSIAIFQLNGVGPSIALVIYMSPI